MDLLGYVKKIGKKSFSKVAFNEVDALILSRLAFYNFDNIPQDITFKEISKIDDLSIFTNTKNLRASDTNLLKIVTKARRYKNIYISHFYKDYNKDQEKQFAAMCFYLSEDTACIAFRGTDGTLVGWKENFNMITMDIIPSQICARAYFDSAVKDKNLKKIYPIGHSKGGNLAVYAASFASDEIMQKIDTIYNFDGPGFPKCFYELENYKKIKNKIVKLMPPQSVIGRILYDDEYEIIEAEEQLLLQHWPLNWVIEDDKIKRTNRLEAVSNSVDLTLDDLQELFTDQERITFVNLLFKKLMANGKEYLDDVIFNKDELKILIKNCLFEDRKERKELVSLIWRIYKAFRAHYIFEQKLEDLMFENKKKRTGLIAVLKDNIAKNRTR